MKKFVLLLTLSFILGTYSFAQEYATFEITANNEGTGTFNNAALSNFRWSATGTIYKLEILNDEVFDDGNAFENVFGQADSAENLRTQIYPNGEGTAGQPILSKATLTLNFEEITPSDSWGFCLVDIDVEQCLISAIDENDNEVSVEAIDNWIIELFDANLIEDSVNIPKWDSLHAALLGSDTPEDYVVYNNLVIGGLDDSEAAAALFMPDIPLKSLTIVYKNLQEGYFTSYHFYIASLGPTAISNRLDLDMAISPNPANDFIHIKCPQFATNSAMIEIMDISGRKLLEQIVPKGQETTEIDASGLQSGVYFCRIIAKNNSITKKLIIKK